MSEYKIKKAPPELVKGRKTNDYPLANLQVGEMFEIDNNSASKQSVYNAIAYGRKAQALNEKTFTIKTISAQKLAVIRIK